jgi:hypothetical protein
MKLGMEDPGPEFDRKKDDVEYAPDEERGGHPGHAASCTCPDCRQKPVMHDMDEVAPPGREKQVRALKKAKNVDNPWAVAWASYDKQHEALMRETLDDAELDRYEEGRLHEKRARVSPHEVEETYTDLRMESGTVSLEELASWLATTEDAVRACLPRTYLMIDREGNVVERGSVSTVLRGKSALQLRRCRLHSITAPFELIAEIPHLEGATHQLGFIHQIAHHVVKIVAQLRQSSLNITQLAVNGESALLADRHHRPSIHHFRTQVKPTFKRSEGCGIHSRRRGSPSSC